MLSSISKKRLLKDFILNLVPSVLGVYFLLSRSHSYLESCTEEICNLLAYIGLSFLFKVFVDSLIAFYRRKIRLGHGYILQPGRWAIVTAASSAVGQAFCSKLARADMNLILIGKEKRKLENLQRHLEDINPKIRAKVIVHDCSSVLSDTFKEMMHNKLGKLLLQYKSSKRGGISMLVHCANTRNEIPVEVHEMMESEREIMLNTNVFSSCHMIELVAPYMAQQGRAHNGSIILVNSHSCHHPAPMMSVYSATNQFRNSLSQSLYHDLKAVGIAILSVTPELMSSNMPRKAENAKFVRSPSADKIVRTALANLGHQDEIFPFIGHIQSTVMQNNIWSHPWERFLNKMKIARSELLFKKHLKSGGEY